MKRRIWFGLILLLFSNYLIAQNISGKVYDQISRSPISGASIIISGSSIGTSTEVDGSYGVTGLKPGRYTLQISHLEYETLVINNVWVKSGVITKQDIELTKAVTNLDEVVVFVASTLSKPGTERITEEAINRYAAAYNDPARLITSSPDITIVNDQNNLVSVRGVSPDYNVWRLEGVEIINPNHLSNAGTFLDQPTASGGGVNILSAQMLGESDFRYGTYSAQYGNSIGGIFDMNLKSGNLKERQFTTQASFIGFDLASEGPVIKGKPTTYAINYRYSFTGLLSNLGVDFGGESIGYQDISFNVVSPIDERSTIKFFGMGGNSFNDFKHKTFAESEFQKDRSDINYDNKTGAIGINYRRGLNYGSGSVNATIVLSGYENERNQKSYDKNDSIESYMYNQKDESVLGTQIQYLKNTSKGNFNAGLNLNFYNLKKVSSIPLTQGYYKRARYLVNPYFNYNHSISSRFDIQSGFSYLIANSKGVIDPRLSANYYLSKNHVLTGSLGMYSQILNADNIIYNNPYQRASDPNLNSSFIRSARSSIQYGFEKPQFRLYIEGYYYYFLKVLDQFEDQSDAATYGVSITAERSFFQGFYYKAGTNVFRSYIDQESTHFDLKHSSNLSFGKEWQKIRNGVGRSLSINVKGYFQGGRYFASNIDTSLGSVAPTIRAYRQSDFFRMDLRVIWTRSREKFTSSIALDIQNVTNTQNESFRYYDTFTNQVQSHYNLGLIPILTYRVEW